MTTKAELVQINSRLAAENEALRAKLSEQTAIIRNLNIPNIPPVGRRVAESEQNDRLNKMRVAREAAMHTGRVQTTGVLQ